MNDYTNNTGFPPSSGEPAELQTETFPPAGTEPVPRQSSVMPSAQIPEMPRQQSTPSPANPQNPGFSGAVSYAPPAASSTAIPAGAAQQPPVPGQAAAPAYYNASTYSAHPPGTPYNPYMPITPPKKKGGCLRVFGLVCGTVIGIFVLAFAIGIVGNLIQTSVGSGSPSYSEGSEPPASSGSDDSLTSSKPPIVPVDPSQNANPNGPALHISPLPGDPGDTTSVKDIAAKFRISVVSISLYTEKDNLTQDTLYSEGTGIVMTADGYILTNAHVIQGSYYYGYTVQITTNTQEEYIAKIVGLDNRTDLAVLKVDATGLTPADFGDSTRLEVGDPLVAIGNGGGIKFAGSVTSGIVSAVDRTIDSDIEGAIKYIQTDAAINPGNSGGPLINQYGQVIGVNTAKIVLTGYEGMGFAIPSATVKPIVDDLIRFGYVTGRSRLGITCETKYTASGYRVVILSFSEDSPFLDTSAKLNDVIVEMGGHEIYTISDVYAVIDNYKPGQTIEVKLVRPTGLISAYDFSNMSNAFTVTVKLLPDDGNTLQVVPDDSTAE